MRERECVRENERERKKSRGGEGKPKTEGEREGERDRVPKAVKREHTWMRRTPPATPLQMGAADSDVRAVNILLNAGRGAIRGGAEHLAAAHVLDSHVAQRVCERERETTREGCTERVREQEGVRENARERKR